MSDKYEKVAITAEDRLSGDSQPLMLLDDYRAIRPPPQLLRKIIGSAEAEQKAGAWRGRWALAASAVLLLLFGLVGERVLRHEDILPGIELSSRPDLPSRPFNPVGEPKVSLLSTPPEGPGFWKGSGYVAPPGVLQANQPAIKQITTRSFFK